MSDERDDKIEKALPCGHGDGTHVTGCPAIYRKAVRALLIESRNELLEQVAQAVSCKYCDALWYVDQRHGWHRLPEGTAPNSAYPCPRWVIRSFQSDPQWLEQHDAEVLRTIRAEFTRGFPPTSSVGCPMCVYENGVFKELCVAHKEMKNLRSERDKLRAMFEVLQTIRNKFPRSAMTVSEAYQQMCNTIEAARTYLAAHPVTLAEKKEGE